MTATIAARIHRPFDVVCECHRSVTIWPHGGLKTFFQTCDDCGANLDALREPNGDCWIRIGRDWTPRQADEWNAYHEAGHAVVGMLAGQDPVEVAITDPTRPPTDDPSGWVSWGDDFSLDVGDYLAMAWAGREASLVWLTRAGLDTPENRFDVFAGASADAASAYAEAERHGLGPTTAVRTARWIVVDRWAEVSALAEGLLVARRLTGREARVAAGL